MGSHTGGPARLNSPDAPVPLLKRWDSSNSITIVQNVSFCCLSCDVLDQAIIQEEVRSPPQFDQCQGGDVNVGSFEERQKLSFLVDGELRSRARTTALAFSRPRRNGLDIRHRLPGRLVGLAASLRSMPTA